MLSYKGGYVLRYTVMLFYYSLIHFRRCNKDYSPLACFYIHLLAILKFFLTLIHALRQETDLS